MLKPKKKVIKNNYILVAFCLSAFTMLVYCIFTKFRWGEISSLQAGDMLNLYVPAVRSLVRNLYSGQGLEYSWDLFLGMNAVPYYTSVMGGSIVNLIYILFPWISPELFVILALVIKTGLVGASFALYSKKVLKIDGIISVIFGLFYSFCGFQVCINIINYIWIDLLYILPLLLLAINELLEKKRWKRLVLLYAYSFLCCFYIAYIVGLFTALYLVIGLTVRLVLKQEKSMEILEKIGKFGGCVLWAAAMCAFALLPTALFITTKYPPDATAVTKDLVQNDVILLFSRFLVGIPFAQYFNLPFLYSGLPCLLLLPVFFLCNGIEKKEKILYGTLFFITVLSCILLPLYIVWHGFDAPDGWGFRFSFLISFLMAVMACKAAFVVLKESKKKLLIIGGIECLVICLLLLYCNKNKEKALAAPIVWNLFFVTMWVALGFILLYIKKSNKKIKCAIITLALFEVLSNGALQHGSFQSQKELDIFSKEMKDTLNMLEKDQSFYRIQVENSIHENADSYWGYKGIADLCTFENYEVRNALYNLGFYASPRYMTGYGLNPLTQMLLGIKYKITFSDGGEEAAGEKIVFYENNLGIGFGVSRDILDYLFEEDVFVNCNNLASAMMGEKIEVFTAVPQEKISIQEVGIELKHDESLWGYEINRTNQTENIVQLIFSIPNQGKTVYGVFRAYVIGNITGRPYVYELTHVRDCGTFGMRYMKKLDLWGDNQIYDIVMEKGVTNDKDSFIDYEFCYLNNEKIDYIYEKLREETINVSNMRNGVIIGDVQITNANHILFTSIPFDKGWNVIVKNKDTQEIVKEAKTVPLLENAFLGVEIPEVGKYELEFRYEVPGAKKGLVLSFAAFFVFFIMCIVKVKKINVDEKVG